MARKSKSSKPNALAKRLNLSGSTRTTGKVSKPEALQSNPLYNALNMGKSKPSKQAIEKNPLAQALSTKPTTTIKNVSKGSVSKKKPRISTQAKGKDDFSFAFKDKDEISFKTASKPKFLRINNLIKDVTASEVESVVSKVSPVKKVLTKQMPDSRTMCEVFFEKGEKVLPFAFENFHLKKLDAKIMTCEIDDTSKILKGLKYQLFLKELNKKQI